MPNELDKLDVKQILTAGRTFSVLLVCNGDGTFDVLQAHPQCTMKGADEQALQALLRGARLRTVKVGLSDQQLLNEVVERRRRRDSSNG